MFTVKKAFGLTILSAFIIAAAFGAASAQAAPAATTGMVDYDFVVTNHPDIAKANDAFRIVQEAAKKEFEEKSPGLGDKEKQDLDRQLKQQVEQKRRELLQPILDSVNAAIKEVAEAKRLTVVMHKNTVAWGGPNITEDVLKKLAGK